MMSDIQHLFLEEEDDEDEFSNCTDCLYFLECITGKKSPKPCETAS